MPSTTLSITSRPSNPAWPIDGPERLKMEIPMTANISETAKDVVRRNTEEVQGRGNWALSHEVTHRRSGERCSSRERTEANRIANVTLRPGCRDITSGRIPRPASSLGLAVEPRQT